MSTLFTSSVYAKDHDSTFKKRIRRKTEHSTRINNKGQKKRHEQGKKRERERGRKLERQKESQILEGMRATPLLDCRWCGSAGPEIEIQNNLLSLCTGRRAWESGNVHRLAGTLFTVVSP